MAFSEEHVNVDNVDALHINSQYQILPANIYLNSEKRIHPLEVKYT